MANANLGIFILRSGWRVRVKMTGRQQSGRWCFTFSFGVVGYLAVRIESQSRDLCSFRVDSGLACSGSLGKIRIWMRATMDKLHVSSLSEGCLENMLKRTLDKAIDDAQWESFNQRHKVTDIFGGNELGREQETASKTFCVLDLKHASLQHCHWKQHWFLWQFRRRFWHLSAKSYPMWPCQNPSSVA